MDGTMVERYVYRISPSHVLWGRGDCRDCGERIRIAVLIATVDVNGFAATHRIVQCLFDVHHYLCLAVRQVAEFGRHMVENEIPRFTNKCGHCHTIHTEETLTMGGTLRIDGLRAQPIPEWPRMEVTGQLGSEIAESLLDEALRNRFRRDLRQRNLFDFPPFKQYRW